MGTTIPFNRGKFFEVFEEQGAAVKSMVEAMEAIGDPREICVIEIMKEVGKFVDDLMAVVDQGKKRLLWHEFLFFPEIFRGFPDVHPVMAEILAGFLPLLDPEGVSTP